jgi:hypothetical protein
MKMMMMTIAPERNKRSNGTNTSNVVSIANGATWMWLK